MNNELYDEEERQIECKCQSCNEITIHNLIIDDDDEDAEATIQCVVCEETQDYHPKRAHKKNTAKKATNSKLGLKEKNGVTDFKKLLTKHDASTAIQYAMTHAFKSADVINHQAFGIGFVRETIFPNKIEVLFSEGCKLLICAPHTDRNPALKAAGSAPKKSGAHKSRSPSTWQPWSSAGEEKKDHKFGWGDNELSE